MPAPVPPLKANKVVEEVGALIQGATTYFAADDARVVRLLQDAESFLATSPTVGHCAKACVYQLAGNAERVRYHLDSAARLSHDAAFHACRSAILANLGLASEGQASFDFAVQPLNGRTRSVWNQGYALGAYRAMRDAGRAARELKLDLGTLDVATAEKAAGVLDRRKLVDSDAAVLFDAAGEVMRAHRLFYIGPTPRTEVRDGEDAAPFVKVTFRVEAPQEVVDRMRSEFAGRISEKAPKARQAIRMQFEGNR